ncbi:MAG: ATP-binding cassette domain-containing protein [Saprospiraceae bacterium]
MHYLTLDHADKSFGEKILFEDVSLMINKGEKIALIAPNGSGKSCLLRMIAGIEPPEGENATYLLSKNIKLAFLDQDPSFNPETSVLDSVLDSDLPAIKAVKKYEIAQLHSEQNPKLLEEALHEMDLHKAWDIEVKVKEILFKLNLTDLEQKVKTLSGGQVKRLALAHVLLEQADLIILDEPSNHLDLDMIEWLEEYLRAESLTALMVTHDRYFLDNVCNIILELYNGKLHRYTGNYSSFLEKKEALQGNEAIKFDKLRQLYKKELAWVRRQPKARTTKSKSRVDQFAVIDDALNASKAEQKLRLEFSSARLGSKILELNYINKAYGEKILIKDFHYNFKKGERIGIVGANGAGKSTLLNIIMGKLQPDHGKIVSGSTVKYAYYEQSGMALDDDKRVIEVIQDLADNFKQPDGTVISVAQLLERFMFDRKKQQVYVSKISGGEKRRLYLLTILMQQPNFLILDEPTNDLDIFTLQVIEEYLNEYPGCLIVVSHDRFFLDKIVDHLFVFEGEGVIKDYNGNYTQYRLEQESKKYDDLKPKENASLSASQQNRESQKALSRLEKDLEKLNAKRKELQNRFEIANISTDDLIKWSTELKEVVSQIEVKENEWLALAE